MSISVAIIAGLVIALAIVTALWWLNAQAWAATADALEADRERGWTKLHALRCNCFVTNEKGHRVRYSEASAAVRARVEV